MVRCMGWMYGCTAVAPITGGGMGQFPPHVNEATGERCTFVGWSVLPQ